MGRFSPDINDLVPPREGFLSPAFANWPTTPAGIQSFTQSYGPLDLNAVPGGTFAFPLTDFVQAQHRVHDMWKNPAGYGELYVPAERLTIRSGTMTFYLPNLYWYVVAELLSTPAERVRICRRVGCVHPYFIADTLRRQFCSDECAEEEQRTLKRTWWQTSGGDWRAKRRSTNAKKEHGDGAD